MKKRKNTIKKYVMFMLLIGNILMVQNVHAEDEPRTTIVRAENGDLEELKAICVSDEKLEGYHIDSSFENASGNSEQTEFLTLGSRYGYEDMAKRSNGAQRQELYQQMEKICEDFTLSNSDATSFALQGNTYYSAGTANASVSNMANHELFETYFTFRNDNPQYFWLSNTVVCGDHSIVVLAYDDYKEGNFRKDALNTILTTLDETYRGNILNQDTIYQKTLKIHDSLIGDIEYSDSAGWISHSIAGALAGNKAAVCEGYAKVMQLLLNEYHITNIYVTGDAGGGHAWNMVKMKDNNYYWLDSTWDDQKYEEYCHTYFLVGNQNFTDHKADVSTGINGNFLYDLPVASDIDYLEDSIIPENMPGDVNADGIVNLKDLMIVLKHVSGKAYMTEGQCQVADVSEDGNINLKDLMKMLNYVSGKIASLS